MSASSSLKPKPRPPPPARRQSLSTGSSVVAQTDDAAPLPSNDGDRPLRRVQSERPSRFKATREQSSTAAVHAAELTKALQRRRKEDSGAVTIGKSASAAGESEERHLHTVEESSEGPARVVVAGVELLKDAYSSQHEQLRLQLLPEADDILSVEIQLNEGEPLHSAHTGLVLASVLLEDDSEDTRRLLVKSVAEDGSAARLGLSVGDEIFEINGKPTRGVSLEDISSFLGADDSLIRFGVFSCQPSSAASSLPQSPPSEKEDAPSPARVGKQTTGSGPITRPRQKIRSPNMSSGESDDNSQLQKQLALKTAKLRAVEAELSATQAKADAQVLEAEAELQELKLKTEEDVSRLQEEIAALQEEHNQETAQLKQELEDLRNSKSHDRRKCTALEKKFAAAEELQKMAEDDVQRLQEELASLRQEMPQNHEKTSTDCGRNDEQTSASIIEERDKLIAEKADLEKRVAELEQDVAGVSSENDRLNRVHTQETEELRKRLHEQQLEASEKVKRLEEKLSESESRSASEVEELRGELSEKEREASEKITELEGRLRENEEGGDAATKQLAALHEKLQRQAMELNKMTMLEEELKRQQGSGTMAAQEVFDLKEELSNQKATLKQSDEKIASLTEQLESAERELAAAQQKIDTLEDRLISERAEAEQLIAELEAKIEQAQTELEEQQQECDQLNVQVTLLQANNDINKEKISFLEKQLAATKLSEELESVQAAVSDTSLSESSIVPSGEKADPTTPTPTATGSRQTSMPATPEAKYSPPTAKSSATESLQTRPEAKSSPPTAKSSAKVSPQSIGSMGDRSPLTKKAAEMSLVDKQVPTEGGEDLADVIAALKASRASKSEDEKVSGSDEADSPDQKRKQPATSEAESNKESINTPIADEESDTDTPKNVGRSLAAGSGKRGERNTAVAALAAAIGGSIPALPSRKPRGLFVPAHRGGATQTPEADRGNTEEAAGHVSPVPARRQKARVPPPTIRSPPTGSDDESADQTSNPRPAPRPSISSRNEGAAVARPRMPKRALPVPPPVKRTQPDGEESKMIDKEPEDKPSKEALFENATGEAEEAEEAEKEETKECEEKEADSPGLGLTVERTDLLDSSPAQHRRRLLSQGQMSSRRRPSRGMLRQGASQGALGSSASVVEPAPSEVFDVREQDGEEEQEEKEEEEETPDQVTEEPAETPESDDVLPVAAPEAKSSSPQPFRQPVLQFAATASELKKALKKPEEEEASVKPETTSAEVGSMQSLQKEGKLVLPAEKLPPPRPKTTKKAPPPPRPAPQRPPPNPNQPLRPLNNPNQAEDSPTFAPRHRPAPEICQPVAELSSQKPHLLGATETISAVPSTKDGSDEEPAALSPHTSQSDLCKADVSRTSRTSKSTSQAGDSDNEADSRPRVLPENRRSGIRTVLDWEEEDVHGWLHLMSLGSLVEIFKQNEIDGRKLLQLDSSKMKAMGVSDAVHIATLKKEIKMMKAQMEKIMKDEKRRLEKEAKVEKKRREEEQKLAKKAEKRSSKK